MPRNLKPKKISYIIAGVLVALIGIIFEFFPPPNALPPSSENSKASVEEGLEKMNASGALVKIARIIDGDTVEIENGEKLRYIGIDTPETLDPRKPVQCFGREASNKNKEIAEGKTARLEKDVNDRDQFGRLLRYVWIGDTFVNLELVRQGYAYASAFPPDIKYQKLFEEAEKSAREQELGLWKSCP